jgi:hypothetical protein
MNINTFTTEYEKQLAAAVVKYPDEYMFPLTEVPVVSARMKAAFIRGSYSKDGRAIKATCKVLGIGYTYNAINTYIRS